MAVRLRRTSFLFCGEGPGDQSFGVWLHRLADNLALNVHLDCRSVSGGGYKSMLATAAKFKKQGAYQSTFLMIDADRAEINGEWTLQQLRTEAQKAGITVICNKPNLEGLLFRLHESNTNKIPSKMEVITVLKRVWPSYEKGVSADVIGRRFNIDDILRLAHVDNDIRNLLAAIGFQL